MQFQVHVTVTPFSNRIYPILWWEIQKKGHHKYKHQDNDIQPYIKQSKELQPLWPLAECKPTPQELRDVIKIGHPERLLPPCGPCFCPFCAPKRPQNIYDLSARRPAGSCGGCPLPAHCRFCCRAPLCCYPPQLCRPSGPCMPHADPPKICRPGGTCVPHYDPPRLCRPGGTCVPHYDPPRLCRPGGTCVPQCELPVYYTGEVSPAIIQNTPRLLEAGFRDVAVKAPPKFQRLSSLPHGGILLPLLVGLLIGGCIVGMCNKCAGTGVYRKRTRRPRSAVVNPTES